MEFVDKLEAHHVLAAIRLLGWEIGKKPPTYAAIQAKCKEIYGNGGDGNRCSELRQQAMLIAQQDAGALPQEQIGHLPPQLPGELEDQLKALIDDIGKRLDRFDFAAASYLESFKRDLEADAQVKITALRQDASEAAAAFAEEIEAAMAALRQRDELIDDLRLKLTGAIETANQAAGRASAFEAQIFALQNEKFEVQRERDEAIKGRAVLEGRLNELEKHVAKVMTPRNGKIPGNN